MLRCGRSDVNLGSLFASGEVHPIYACFASDAASGSNFGYARSIEPSGIVKMFLRDSRLDMSKVISATPPFRFFKDHSFHEDLDIAWLTLLRDRRFDFFIDNFGSDLLHAALRGKCLQISKFLLKDSRVDPNFVAFYQQQSAGNFPGPVFKHSCFQLAVESRSIDMMKLLAAHHKFDIAKLLEVCPFFLEQTIRADKWDPIDYEILRFVVHLPGMPINGLCEGGLPAGVVAVIEGVVTTLQIILEHPQIDIHIVDPAGKSALDRAIMQRRLLLVKALLQHEAKTISRRRARLKAVTRHAKVVLDNNIDVPDEVLVTKLYPMVCQDLVCDETYEWLFRPENIEDERCIEIRQLLDRFVNNFGPDAS